jgi:hypothetical protein
VPFVSITLDRQPALHAFHYQIDAIPMIGGIPDAHLGAHMETLAVDHLENVPLKLGIEAVRPILSRLATRVEHVAQ